LSASVFLPKRQFFPGSRSVFLSFKHQFFTLTYYFDKNNIAIFETSNHSKFYLKSERQVKAVSANRTEFIYTIDFDMNIVKFALGFGFPKFIISMKANSNMKKYLRQLKNHLGNL